MKKFLVAMGLAAFAVVGCDDSSSASAGQNDEPGVESSSSSSGKVTEPDEVTSSSSEKAKSSSSDPRSEVKQSSSSEMSGKSSSSGEKETSSSSVKSEFSSSAGEVDCSALLDGETKWNWDVSKECRLNPEITYGTMTDSRDGQIYKTVTIGTQTWMAENLNYAYTDVPCNYIGYTSDSTSWCYDNDPANCTKYGRLYTWAAAMDSVGTWSNNGKGCGYGSTCSPTLPVRGICPEGWHLPTKSEFETLFTAVGGQSRASIMLRSTGSWKNHGNGTDDFGFSALPAGYLSNGGYFSSSGYYAYFWSTTEDDDVKAYNVYLYYYNESAFLSSRYKDFALSVRCLRD